MLGGMIPPAAVAAQTQKLLKSRHWLTAAQEGQALDLKLKRILTTLESRFLDLDNAKMQLRLIKEIGDRLEKRIATSEHDLNTIYEAQGRIMGKAYDIALSYMKGALRADVDPDTWDELAKEALAHAQNELQKYVEAGEIEA